MGFSLILIFWLIYYINWTINMCDALKSMQSFKVFGVIHFPYGQNCTSLLCLCQFVFRRHANSLKTNTRSVTKWVYYIYSILFKLIFCQVTCVDWKFKYYHKYWFSTIKSFMIFLKLGIIPTFFSLNINLVESNTKSFLPLTVPLPEFLKDKMRISCAHIKEINPRDKWEYQCLESCAFYFYI